MRECSNAIIYARSSEHQSDVSNDEQINACKVFAIQHDLNIVGTYADTAQFHRPQFQQLLNNCCGEDYSVLLVYDTSKLGHYTKNAHMYLSHLHLNNVTVIGVAEKCSHSFGHKQSSLIHDRAYDYDNESLL